MPPPHFRRRADPLSRPASTLILTALILGSALVSARARAQAPAQPKALADDLARQVTLFGVLASPHDLKTDPKLAKIEPQLRKLFPKHGFRLLDVQSKRLVSRQSIGCDLESGSTAEVTLLQPIDANGKVRLRCLIRSPGSDPLETVVATPPNQLFFCDKTLADGARLLIAVGAR